MAKKTNKLT